jgi:hypothetical protein
MMLLLRDGLTDDDGVEEKIGSYITKNPLHEVDYGNVKSVYTFGEFTFKAVRSNCKQFFFRS